MDHASYRLTGDPRIPAVVTVNGASTPVWLQQCWQTGPYAFYVRRNGCGHCCTAMAARLRGASLDPHQEYVLCRSLWGPPEEKPDDKGQDHFLSSAGIVKVLQSLQIPAQAFGVREDGPERATDRILQALGEGKQVIFASDPDDWPENPFSDGYHWVMAVGFAEDGRILVANSSQRAVREGIQLVDRQTIEKALFRNASYDPRMTWGELEKLCDGCGYVIVGS